MFKLITLQKKMLRPKCLYLISFKRTLTEKKAKPSIEKTLKPFRSPLQNTINVAFGKYLLITNTVSSGVLMFFGDLAQQEIEYQQKKLPERYDYARLGRMFTVGLGLGPLHHYYYNYINKILPKTDVRSITKKILFDQFIMSPICIFGFFYSVGLLEMKSIGQCTEEINNKFIEVYKTDWSFWPPAQYLNFYFVPPKYQVFVINALTMVYNVYLSYIKHRELAEKNALVIKQMKQISN